MKEKKTNSYKRALKIMGSAMVVGGVLGEHFRRPLCRQP